MSFPIYPLNYTVYDLEIKMSRNKSKSQFRKASKILRAELKS